MFKDQIVPRPRIGCQRRVKPLEEGRPGGLPVEIAAPVLEAPWRKMIWVMESLVPLIRFYPPRVTED